MKKNIDQKLSLYLILLFLFSIVFLYIKHKVGNDSTISEWLINYEGGFTKRGIMGQLSIFLSRAFDEELRWVIFLIQTGSCAIYFILIFNFFKNNSYDRISSLAIFTPIFILYPVAEIEVLARKEILVFSLYLLYLTIPKINFYKNFSLMVFFVLSILIWEPIIFFTPIFLLLEIIEKKINNFNLDLIKSISLFLPGAAIGFYFAFNPITPGNHEIMSNVLKNEFNENCYMSCALLISKSSIIQQFAQYHAYSFERIFRYILIIIIGFFPIFLLLKNSILKKNNIFFLKKFKNLLHPTLICLAPVILLFAMGYDWGRWVNITYVFVAIFYFYLSKNNLIVQSENLKNFFVFKLSRKVFIFIFIVFCFGWNPKTTVTGDVASFPGYRIPYKVMSYFIRGHL
tara:strand:+ start:1728 stop:2927 length:1200 start_codon:yes stop_codon:yes gene_type:complete